MPDVFDVGPEHTGLLAGTNASNGDVGAELPRTGNALQVGVLVGRVTEACFLRALAACLEHLLPGEGRQLPQAIRNTPHLVLLGLTEAEVPTNVHEAIGQRDRRVQGT